jgi:hypothetical protein
MKRFIRIGMLCTIVFAGAALGLSIFSNASAGSVKPVVAAPVDYPLGGEPGEDPHLRVRSAMKIRPVLPPEGSSRGGAGGCAITSGTEILVSEDRDHRCCIIYRGAIWRILAVTLSGVLSR